MVHFFDVAIAKEYGVNAAILLQNIQYWVAHNKANEKCFYEGRYWTYNSVKAFKELFPYLSEYQIGGALNKLLDDGILVKGNFNKSGMDRTSWYSLTDKGQMLVDGNIEPNATKPEDLPNPFAGDDIEIQDTVELYAVNNLFTLSPGNMREIDRYKLKLSDELIRHAIDEACANGARSWNYTRRILDRYIENQYKTIGQVLAAEDERKRRIEGSTSQPQASGKGWQDMTEQERDAAMRNGPFGKFYN